MHMSESTTLMFCRVCISIIYFKAPTLSLNTIFLIPTWRIAFKQCLHGPDCLNPDEDTLTTRRVCSL